MPCASCGWTRASLTVGLLLAASGAHAANATPALALRAGLARAVGAPAPAGTGALLVLAVDWSAIESASDARDWSGLDAAVESATRAGHEVALVLGGRRPAYLPPGPVPAAADQVLEPWLAFVRAAVARYAGRLAAVQIGERIGDPATGPDALEYAFVLKQSAVAARAEARAAGAAVAIAQASVPIAARAFQRELWRHDVASYVDVLPLRVDASSLERDTLRRALGELATESLSFPPAPALWAVLDAPGAGPWEAAAGAVVALAAGARAAVLVEGEQPDPALERWTVDLAGLLGRGFGPAPLGDLRLEGADLAPLPGGEVLARFADEQATTTLLFVRGRERNEVARLVVGAAAVRDPRLVAAGGETMPLPFGAVAGQPGRWAIGVPVAGEPRGVLLDLPASPPELAVPAEQLDVSAVHELSAEEIIARHQEVQREQDHRLERWMARGRADLHFKLDQAGSTVDLTIVSNYFWERDRPLEWEQVEYYFNGNRVTWKKIPELPIVQPEKVLTLPLDLTFDRTYVYRLAGRDRVGEREAWVLEFAPADTAAASSLYRGRVWIDRASFVRLKTQSVQTGLAAPVTSNEEVGIYEPVTAPDGQDYWMLARLEGQQLWNAFGRTLVVRRTVAFDHWRINPPAQEAAAERARAYASNHHMLRDTDSGFRYLERQPDGSRTLQEEVDSSRLFAGGGAFKDSSTDGVVPLAGVNWFDYDLAGRDIQLNVFFAGVLAFVTASKPDLAGGRVALTGDLALNAIDFDDKLFQGEDELLEERLEQGAQHAALRLGLPLGTFFKLHMIARLTARHYEDDVAAVRARAEHDAAFPGTELTFVLPQDHWERESTLEGEFERWGWTLRARYSRARRQNWSTWGLFDSALGQYGALDPATGVFVPGPPEPASDAFSRWGATGFREWVLPNFQKLRGEIDYLDGQGLDRFSRYTFEFFGEDRLDGFAGSGVRFDRGTILRAGWSFNLLEAVRLDATVGQARVRGPAADGQQVFTGIGLSANVVGPWRTMIAGSWGRALSSDIPDLEGQQEFMLLVLKLF